MANEDKKDFNAMLHDSKDMPKFQTITDPKSIEKYGGNKMYFAPPIDYDKIMKQIPHGKVITVGKIREYFAELNGADFTEDAELLPTMQPRWPGLAHSGKKPLSLYVLIKPSCISLFTDGNIKFKNGNKLRNVSQNPVSVNI